MVRVHEIAYGFGGPTGQGPIIAKLHVTHEFFNQFLKKITVTSLELDNKIISLYLCIFQRNQINFNKTLDYIFKDHGEGDLMFDSWFLYLIIIVFVIMGLSAFLPRLNGKYSKWVFKRSLNNDDTIRFCFKTFFNFNTDKDLIFHI